MRYSWSALLISCLAACPSATPKPDAGLNLPLRCGSGSEWGPGQVAFRNATDRAGFAALGVRGTRINVLDFDADGYPDLFVRHGAGPDDFSPEGERSRWLLRNRGDGSFEDVTERSGLLTDRSGVAGALLGSVVAVADVNNDGHVDVFIAVSSDDGARASELMLGDGGGIFRHGPESSGARRAGVRSHPAGLSFTDADRDGAIDLWMTQNKLGNASSPLPDNLYFGRADGSLTDGSRAAGITTRPWGNDAEMLNRAEGHSWSWGATACDLDGDGVPELLSPSYGRCPNTLWLGAMDNDGRVTYQNHSLASGYAYDNNQNWHDNQSARCYCKLNPNAVDCAGVPAPQGLCTEPDHILRWSHNTDREAWRLGGNSGGSVCGDVDNDGQMDLLTSEIVHWDVGANSDAAELLFGSGESPLRLDRPGNAATGLARRKAGGSWDEGIITSNILDFDNDAWPDIYFGGTDYRTNRALLFHQVRPRQFEKVPTPEGIDFLRAHGSAIADFDRDGDLDIVVGHSRMRCGQTGECLSPPIIAFFENLLGANSNWVQLRLVGGRTSNRSAIGARVQVSADGTTQLQEVSAGQGHYGNQNDSVLHFGLGLACSAEVVVTWPDFERTTQRFAIQSGYRYEVVQGAPPKVTP
jgi:hypothetical protein